jgi:hypothetical protein
MSIIPCPECQKKVSSRAAICSHCGHAFGEVTQEDLDIFAARRLRDQIYRLNMISYAVITAFLGAFAWYWIGSAGFSRPPGAGPVIGMSVAALAYLAVRGLLFRRRQQRKALREKRNMSSDLRRNL